MMKRFLAVFLVLATLMCLLCACGEATSSSSGAKNETTASARAATNEIVVGIAQDLDNSLDPYQSSAAGTREVMFNVFEGLVKPNSDGDLVEAVASKYEITDGGLTYTFTLREGVVFHNGATCTTDDVLYSFETCASTSVYANVVEALSAITAITVEGQDIIVQLAEPNPDFLAILTSVQIVPAGYTDQATAPIGTGPFKYASRSVQENFVLEKHTEYYGEPAKLDKVTYRIYEDSSAVITALESGALDMMAHLTTDQINNLTNGYTVLEGTMNLVQAVYLNHRFEPFSDLRVRQALCHAIDVDTLMAINADGHGTKVGSSMYPNFSKYFDASLAQTYPYDVAKAKELLAQAGYGDGFSFRLALPSNYPQHVAAGVVIAEQLKAVGITVEIEKVEWNTWLEDVYANRNFDATIVGFDASILSPTALLARWVSDSGKNMIGFNNEKYDQTYAEAMKCVDDEEQTQLYKRCLEILNETAANVYLQDLADFVAMHPDLEGFEFYPLYVIDMSTVYWTNP